MNGYSVNERDLGRIKKIRLSMLLPLSFLLIGISSSLFQHGFVNLYHGLKDIILSPTLLITDFLEVGGLSATFINVAIISFVNLLLIDYYKLKMNGVLIAAFFTLIGFSFFGKNIYNIVPIYIGGFLFARYQKISFKEVIVVIMFGTALSPFISEISFLGIFPTYISIGIAIVLGMFIGFIIVPLSAHMLRFHDGYNIYNIGFTAGIIGTLLASFLRSFGLEIEPVYIIFEYNQSILIYYLIALFIGLFVLGIYINKNSLKEYKNILVYKGKLVTDFTHLVGYGVTFVNMSLLGFIGLFYVLAVGGIVNGPAIAGIFTFVGFGAFGKHPKNCLPVILGVIVTALFFHYDLASTGIILAVLFSTTLAPIAGTYGPYIGFAAGVLHMILVTNVGVIHGGINLYNNGFSGGLVAGILVPVVDAFRKDD